MRFILGRARTAEQAREHWAPVCADTAADRLGLGFWAGFADDVFLGWWDASPRFGRLLADLAAFALLAGSRSDPVGYAVVTLRPTVYCEGRLAVLDELYVRPGMRGGGIGTTLLTAAVREVRRRGGGEMHINVDEIDVDARRFYERHGFVNIEPGTDYRMLCYIAHLAPPPKSPA